MAKVEKVEKSAIVQDVAPVTRQLKRALEAFGVTVESIEAMGKAIPVTPEQREILGTVANICLGALRGTGQDKAIMAGPSLIGHLLSLDTRIHVSAWARVIGPYVAARFVLLHESGVQAHQIGVF